MNMLILVGFFTLVLISILIAILTIKIIRRRRPKSKYTGITTTTKTAFVQPSAGLKCTYTLDFSVFNSSSSKDVHILYDRKSPVFKLDMGTGRLIIEYLSTADVSKPVNQLLAENGIVVTTETVGDSTSSNTIQTCVCPTIKTTSRYGKDKFPTTMKVVTPSIPFQRKNTIEIRQNLREIDVYLNGKFFYSTLLEFVPYLFSGNGTLLPNESCRHIRINSFTFKDTVIE